MDKVERVMTVIMSTIIWDIGTVAQVDIRNISRLTRRPSKSIGS
jgi:hypothetical protein